MDLRLPLQGAFLLDDWPPRVVVAACDLTLLFPFVPGWSTDPFHCLLCLVLLIDPVTSIWFCLLSADLGLC